MIKEIFFVISGLERLKIKNKENIAIFSPGI